MNVGIKYPAAFAQGVIVNKLPHFHRSFGEYSFVSPLSQNILMFHVFRPANQTKRNALQTSNFAVATSLM